MIVVLVLVVLVLQCGFLIVKTLHDNAEEGQLRLH